ncbi:hypothetical protein [Candidatus Poriferisodalis sp.]|uniref:hypothetical protein n=1 Tax=Candidatus Poriferisodalis sp. TaxID=3101277 RepID=UPI003B024956
MSDDVPILDSARRHGISDADIHHAYRNAIGAFYLDNGSEMIVGADYSGRYLEVALGYSDDDEAEAIFHAMPAREQYLRRVL